MTPRKKRNKSRRKPMPRMTRTTRKPDLTSTKTHLANAGHELLLAAEDLLCYCKAHVEQRSTKKPYRDWIRTLKRLSNNVESSYERVSDYGYSILNTTPIKEAAEKLSSLRAY